MVIKRNAISNGFKKAIDITKSGASYAKDGFGKLASSTTEFGKKAGKVFTDTSKAIYK